MQKYLFSNRKQELIYFYTPVFLTCLLFLIPNESSQWLFQLPLIYIGLQMIDSGHIWPSFLIAYSSERAKIILRLLPVIVLVIYLLIGFYFDKFGIYRLHAYLAAFHFIRQQYGILKLSSNLNPSRSSWINKTEFYSIYAITISSLIGRMSNEGVWMRDADLIQIPELYFHPAMTIFFFTVLLYSSLVLYSYFKYQEFFLSRFLIYTSAIFAWGVIGFTKLPIIALFPLFHDLPYLGLIYRYPNPWLKRVKTYLSKIRFSTVNSSFLVLVVITIFIGSIVEFSLYRYLDLHVDEDLSNSLKVLLCSIAFLPTTTHYLIDGFIWRKDIMPNSILNNSDKS